MTELENYRQRVKNDIKDTVGSKPVQPIVFAGSGLSMRYFSGPGWDQLLSEMASQCPKLKHNYGYYRQSRDAPEMGSLLADRYSQWAWDQNEPKFSEMEPNFEKSSDIYLKTEITRYFKNITPDSEEDISEEKLDDGFSKEKALEEIQKLRKIQPHAIITTNYDQFLENIFNNEDREDEKYDVVVGEKILQSPHKSVGEILKIHGSVTDPESLILTSEDYDEFISRKRYLSSKMLTYFAEHPLLIVGYSATDSNIRSILSWVNQILPEDEVTAEDIYFLEFDREVDERENYPEMKRIQLGQDRFISVKSIIARDFDWVFDAFASGEGFEADVRYLRKLLANTYEVVRSKSSDERVVDHQRIEDVAQNKEELATVLGVSAGGANRGFIFDHDLSPQELYDRIGVSSTYKFKEKVLKPVYIETGMNLTGFNNKYHIAFFNESVTYRRYTDAAVEFFNKILAGEDFDLQIPESRVDEEHEARGLDLSQVLE